ncbi:MAG: tRNA (adenosine(37)-N6)-threonylcarbamoyltransferase complex ATPase subunit type 1 TsaE [Nitrospirae bacterium]|nr:tRNA (adenosine(37)-N6)-threonylcarbamoyltransferase complex ATPase subunit type 1 TsaE [Nitrospirota bacterium]
MRIVTTSPSETEDVGFNIGRVLKSGGRGVILLYGDLGAGKTILVKGIARAFGIKERDIGSASFVIAAEYETTPPFVHIDLYRIEGERDIEGLGIWEYLDSNRIVVVEWAERLADVPEEAIKVRLNYINEGLNAGSLREITIEGVNEEDWDNMQGRQTGVC